MEGDSQQIFGGQVDRETFDADAERMRRAIASGNLGHLATIVSENAPERALEAEASTRSDSEQEKSSSEN